MKQFEYLIENVAILHPDNMSVLDDRGADGWELVCVEPLYGHAIFKRELEEDEE